MALEAFRKIKEDIDSNKPLEQYKKMFSVFVNSIEVYESYVSIALNFLCMLSIKPPKNYGVKMERPLLDENQIVVWNGKLGEYRCHCSTSYYVDFFYNPDHCLKNYKSTYSLVQVGLD